MLDLAALFRLVNETDASDLHLRAGLPPRLRVHGELSVAEGMPPAEANDLAVLIDQSLHEAQRERFDRQGEVDCACVAEDGTRYRANFFRSAGGLAASFRRIPAEIRSLEQLAIPQEVDELAHFRNGLVLVTGATGSGKSSTLAALIDVINGQYMRHILTIEDPVEFIHKNQRSVVHQRCVGEDVADFATGVRDGLRADVDVLLIGELRDLETTRAALTAAETGMVVYGTLHTNDAAQTIDRMIDIFPMGEQDQVRAMLSESLRGVLSQTLLTRADRHGRVAATELLLTTPAIQSLIREGRTHEIPNCLQGGRDKGMWRLDDSLELLLRQGAISRDEAIAAARTRSRFESRKLSPVGS